MTLAFSTSSAWASVALLDTHHEILWADRIHAPMSASAACMKLLESMADAVVKSPADCDLFAADMGPGSFTGVRVGVTLAKTFGFVYGRDVVGATSFDLISATETVVMPSKKGEFFIRRTDCPAIRSASLPEEAFVGFGPGIEDQTYPDAARFSLILGQLKRTDAVSFLPEYLIEPSISIPNKPFPQRGKA